MNLELSAAFIPDADQVYVDFRTDDSGLAVVADEALFTLYQEVQNQVGAKSLQPISQMKVTAPYARAEKNFEVFFLHPPRRTQLVLDVQATYGVTTLTKQVTVGESASPYESMVLPDNAIWEVDPFEVIPTQGGVRESNTPNANPIVLAPEIRSYIKTFEFSVPQPPEVYEDLAYLGGGNRLLVNSASNQFDLQTVDRAPWLIPAFCFMEPAGENLLPNAFFLTGAANQSPASWQIDTSGIIVQQTVDFDHATSSDAKIWGLRLIQNNIVNASLNEVTVNPIAPVGVVADQTYAFSLYCQVVPLARLTRIPIFTLAIRWFDGSTFISESTQDFQSSAYRALSVAAMTGQAPSNATFASVEVRCDLEYGDDLQFNLLGPQLEAGLNPTSRTLTTRLADQFSIPGYNAANQKIRLQMIAGFQSADVTSFLALTGGDLIISFEPGDLVKADLVGYAVVTAPLSFGAGDFLDLTVAHASGQVLSIMREGTVLAQVSCPVVTPNIQPLNIEGIGVELLSLSVFSRV